MCDSDASIALQGHANGYHTNTLIYRVWIKWKSDAILTRGVALLATSPLARNTVLNERDRLCFVVGSLIGEVPRSH